MITKLTIKNRNNEILQTCVFSDEQIMDEFVTLLSINHPWGKPERWVQDFEEDVSNAIDSRLVIEREAIDEILDEQDPSIVIQEALPEQSHYEYKLQSQYVIEYEDVTSEIEDQARKEALRATGARARAACDRAMDIISGHNQNESLLTDEQITTQSTIFAPIVQALSILKRPGKAKELILAVEPDGIIVTQQLKDDALAELEEY